MLIWLNARDGLFLALDASARREPFADPARLVRCTCEGRAGVNQLSRLILINWRTLSGIIVLEAPHMQHLQNQPAQASVAAEQVHHMLMQIKKYRWAGLDLEAEKLVTELARLQPSAFLAIEPPDTD